MKRGMLLIDRGSREEEVIQELEQICKDLDERGDYKFVNYCFLEVRPPYIKDVIPKCIGSDIDELIIVPYFLYPGKKIKLAVNQVMKYQSDTDVKLLVTKVMSMNPTMRKVVDNRIEDALKKEGGQLSKSDVDVLIVGHGSMDPNAQLALKYVVDGLADKYRNMNYCFLEIEQPDISSGIKTCEKNNPNILVVVFYFLHNGAHVQRDILEDLNPALEKSTIKKSIITKHIGVDDMMTDLILERGREVEHAD
ncbi:MAG: CbiX/SirB N-terminal domain-containing protein [Candidatus Nitrosoabyssus spongiisocia]|nr:MAG: CbiX/SirB N-terminal domain-containing protein [Nitrosopumilaceae archaeon AB1(1)]